MISFTPLQVGIKVTKACVQRKSVSTSWESTQHLLAERLCQGRVYVVHVIRQTGIRCGRICTHLSNTPYCTQSNTVSTHWQSSSSSSSSSAIAYRDRSKRHRNVMVACPAEADISSNLHLLPQAQSVGQVRPTHPQGTSKLLRAQSPASRRQAPLIHSQATLHDQCCHCHLPQKLTRTRIDQATEESYSRKLFPWIAPG